MNQEGLSYSKKSHSLAQWRSRVFHLGCARLPQPMPTTYGETSHLVEMKGATVLHAFLKSVGEAF
jgi:hypothetical protein